MRGLNTALLGLCLVSIAAPAWSATYTVDVPLTAGKAAVTSFVQQHGGSVSGGAFSAQGWTTTTRDDFMALKLPPGIDARRGRLTVTFSSPELSGPKGYFESYQLVALSVSGAPFKPVKTGTAGLSTLYIAYTETNEVMAQARGYFNLFDPGCSDWKLCTGEGGSSKGWLNGAGPFTVVQNWTDAVDDLAFTPGGGKKTVNLTSTAPAGVIAAPQLWLTLNACGGSNANACGLWDGPTHGGPLGITYQTVKLELIADCGDGKCSAGIEDAANCASDCGGASDAGSGDANAGGSGGANVGGSGGTDAGADGGGSPGAGGGTSAGGSAGSGVGLGGGTAAPSPSDTGGGCGCRVGRASESFDWLVAAGLLALLLRARRDRGGTDPNQQKSTEKKC